MSARAVAALILATAAAVTIPTGCTRSPEAPLSTASVPRGATSTSPGPSGVLTTMTGYATPVAATDAPKPVPAVLITHGDRASRKVALTFDLCQIPSKPTGFDRAVVDTLLAKKAKATFMMGGNWAETHPEQAKLLGSKAGLFEIGNHSYAHQHPTKISAAAFEQEIVQGQVAISKNAGVLPRLFRFPYGEYDTATLRQVSAHGLRAIQWSVVTGDPDKNITATGILGEVKRLTRGGAIVIMHANGNGVHTAEALPKVIDYLRGKGYELVTVSELLGQAP